MFDIYPNLFVIIIYLLGFFSLTTLSGSSLYSIISVICIFFGSMFIEGDFRNDFNAYLNIFSGLSNERIEPLFLIFNEIFLFLVDDPIILFGIYGAITYLNFKYFICNFLKPDSQKLAMFTFFLLPIFYFGSLNLLRQYFAISLGLYGICSYYKGQRTYGLLGILLGALFHFSIIIYFVFLVVSSKRKFVLLYFILLFISTFVFVASDSYLTYLFPSHYEYFLVRDFQVSTYKTFGFLFISSLLFLWYLYESNSDLLVVTMFLWVFFLTVLYLLTEIGSTALIRLSLIGYPSLLLIIPSIKKIKIIKYSYIGIVSTIYFTYFVSH